MVELRASEKRGEPAVALLLTWFLPGAGHIYLGRFRTGLLAFLLIEGLYALGYFLSEGRAFEFLDPELRGVFATILAPEMGNLGAMIFQHKSAGFGRTALCLRQSAVCGRTALLSQLRAPVSEEQRSV